MPLHIVFIDFTKAFDSVEFPAIWSALTNFGVDSTTTRMIKQLYAAGTSSVVVGESTAPFTTQRDVSLPLAKRRALSA